VLMGVAQRAAIAARLIARGWAAHTPAALLFGASQPGGFTLRTTLGELATAAPPLPATELPAVLVIGGVVSLADVIGQLHSVPLAERSL
jgi:uroporphyrin-III C-methyltransferase/precorrin-2 dehydrogenase/sirohydrochlorin ferrochelatase